MIVFHFSNGDIMTTTLERDAFLYAVENNLKITSYERKGKNNEN